MKIIVDKKQFLNALRKYNRLTNNKGTLYLEAKGEALILKGATNQLSLWLYMKAQVLEEGKVSIDRQPLTNLVDLAVGDITLESQELWLSFENAETFILLPLERNMFFIENDQPPVPNWTHTFDAGTFRKMINGVVHSASNDDTKGALCCIQFLVENNQLMLATTDGYALAYYTEIVEMPDVQLLMNANVIKKIMEFNGSDKLVLSSAGDNILFEQQGNNLRLLTAFSRSNITYPNYQSIIPKQAYHSATIDCAIMALQLRRLAVLGKHSPIKFCFEENAEAVELSMNLVTEGNFRTMLKAETVGSMRIAFDGQFLRRVLSIIEDEKIKIEFTTSARPFTIDTKFGNGKILFVIMPMNPPENPVRP
jgi:DNA polymerase III sliding clamp (beta) subunit (PCNA family)